MIYWLNGAYGVGKSTVAECLKSKLPKAHIFDAEEVGNAIRDNFPEESKYSVIFEGYPLWRELNYKLLKEIDERFNGDVIVPMTLILEASYEEIIQKLAASDVPVLYVILDADQKTIHDRILKRGEAEDCWCMQNINKCLDAFVKDTHAVHIETHGKTPESIADEILAIVRR